MKLLEDIPTFPDQVRKKLRTTLGIETAESFFAQAVNNPEGLGDVLQLSPAEMEKLVKIAEGYLSPQFAERCRHPTTKHPRGLRVNRD